VLSQPRKRLFEILREASLRPYCGATSFTADGIIAACKHEHQSDISDLYQRESICISDYVSSLKHDVQLVRKSKGTPKRVNIYGYVYDINTDELSLVFKTDST
jgi:carbonic anhydrase